MSEIIREYSKALFMLAREGNNEENYEKALDLLDKTFSDNPQYVQFLLSPGIPLDERLNALEKAFSESLPGEVLSFVKLLCEKRYIKHFDRCVVEYKKLLNEISKCSKARVVSAVELNEDEQTALKSRLEKMSGHTVLLECVVDKSILGGLVIELDGKIINSSIQGQLKNIKDVIGK